MIYFELHSLPYTPRTPIMPLIEVLPSNLPSRAAQPGWAYVPDTGPIAAIQPGQRKRGRDDNAFGGSSAKQLKAIEQRLKDLDKENYKDVPIPIPKGDRDRKGRKVTSNVRRILGYSRNFGHYLADEQALIAAGGSSSVAAPVGAVAGAGGVQKDGKRRSDKEVATPASRTSRQSGAMGPPATKPATPLKQEDKDAEMTSPSSSPKRSRSHSQSQTATPAKPLQQPTPAYDPSLDRDPLLRTLNLPSRPSESVMAQLLAEPPLSYSAARAKSLDPEKQVPPRHFCTMCGYWGKVKCRRCGERTCGLMECWRGHEQGGCGQGAY